MRLLTIALVSCGALALACGGTSQDGLFTPMGATGGGSAWASAGGDVAVGGSTSTGGVGTAGVTGGGVTGGGGFTSNGGAGAAGGSLGGGGTLTSAGGALANAGGAIGGGGGSGSGGIGDGAGGFNGSGAGGSSSGGATELPVDAGTAGAGGAPPVVCPTGEYKPKLTGPYTSLGGTKDVGATLDFTISDAGVVKGTFTGPGNAKATISGSIDCATGALTGQILNGTYPAGLTTVKFSGTITGTYDASVGGFTGGTWTITEAANPRNGGTGTW